MAKKRTRNQNPEPFLPEQDDSKSIASNKRSKAPKKHQREEKVPSLLILLLLSHSVCVCLNVCTSPIFLNLSVLLSVCVIIGVHSYITDCVYVCVTVCSLYHRV